MHSGLVGAGQVFLSLHLDQTTGGAREVQLQFFAPVKPIRWRSGGQKSPVAAVAAWQKKNGCPTKPLTDP